MDGSAGSRVSAVSKAEEFNFYAFRETNVKPCPFCGSAPDFYGHGWLAIKCNDCRMARVEDRFGNRDSKSDCERILSRWNRRHSEEPVINPRVTDVKCNHDVGICNHPVSPAQCIADTKENER